MKIDLSQVFKNFDGSPFIENDKKITLGAVACNALQLPYDDESNITGDEKAKRGALAMRIYGEESAEIEVEDVALIKKLIDKMGTPLIVHQARNFLDPKDKK